MANQAKDRGAVLVWDTLRTIYPHLLPTGLGGSVQAEIGIDPNSLTAADFAELAESGRWSGLEQAIGSTGACAHPIWMRGSSTTINTATGEIVSTYSSADEPFGLTAIPCGNRREDKCPACSRVYAADAFHLTLAGVVGGKGVPTSVAENPLIFATFTAPSFGKVHTRITNTGACHPKAHGPNVCKHGQPTTCPLRHGEAEPVLGQPLCEQCYDYASQVIWHYWAPKLWGRFTMALRRALAKDLGIAATKVHQVATIQFVKVAEEQDRAAIHYHALIRLDGPRTKRGFEPAPTDVTAHRFAALIKQAAAHVRLTVPGVDLDDPERVLAFGRQIDTKVVTRNRRTDDPAEDLTPEMVSGYLAKYLTKSSGTGTRANPHHIRLRSTVRRLSGRAAANRDPELRELYSQLRRRIDDNGYRGHRTSKSRRFSVTFGQLRRARRRAARLRAQAERDKQVIDLAAMEDQLLADEADTFTTLGQWSFAGVGWKTNAETQLAIACAARSREDQREQAAAHKNPTTRKKQMREP